jgi:hypothetical protein
LFCATISRGRVLKEGQMAKIIDLRQFQKQKKRKENKWRRQQWRLLRTDGPFVARQEFHCEECIDSIRPGDEYDREIYVNSKHFWIKRKHYPQCFAPTEDDIDEMRKEWEEDEEEEEVETENNIQKCA